MALELDAATAAAILAIQLQDLEKLNDGKDNEEDGCSKDATFAQRLFHEDLKRHVATLHDHQIASCFGESPMENEELPPIPPPFMPGFHILNPSGRQTENPQSTSEFHNVDQQSEQPVDDVPILGLLGLDRYAMEQERLSRKRKASDSPPATCKVSKLSDHTLEDPVCTACMSPILPSDLIQLSCDHSYCMECTMRLFISAMTDETLFPPQCCGISIPLASVQSEVDTEFEEAFNKRQVELSTPASERTYCSNQACSLFLGRRTEGLQEDKAPCPKCHTETCLTCKGVAHESSYCP
ncbi:MAG: hypothetical protein Q9199_003681 [Rusavskia elegans]